MQLSRLEFEDRYAKNDLRIALIGMSNIGKSFTGQRLAQSFNFNLLEVDKIIWENLGKGSMADFAAWQGQPYSCLLYTSPSPRDQRGSRMPSSA